MADYIGQVKPKAMTSLAEVIDDSNRAVNKVWSSDKAGIELDLITTVQEVAANTTVVTPKVYGTSLVIVNAATATITLPSDAPVGGRVHVKKIHATQGAITITRVGTDTITRAGLTSVNLNADGDHWLLQKVSATRWELVDGVSSGENTNGEYVKYANGTLVCNIINTAGGTTATAAPAPIYFGTRGITFPMAFIAVPSVSVSVKHSNVMWSDSHVTSATGCDLLVLSTSPSATWSDIHVIAVGRWK